MKKILVVFLALIVAVSATYATDIKVNGRFGMGYYGEFPSSNIHSSNFAITMGADAYCVEKNIFDIGFNAHCTLGIGSKKVEYSASSSSTTSGSSTIIITTPASSSTSTSYVASFFFGPVVRCNFTDSVSMRLALGYEGCIDYSTLGMEISTDLQITDTLSAGVEFKYGVVANIINVNAVLSIAF